MDALWSSAETRALLDIRAEIDSDFTDDCQDHDDDDNNLSVAHDAYLWELISTRIKERGYDRNPQQCKVKWKNLLSCYTQLQGFEAMEGSEELIKATFPFYKEMQVIFNARMQRTLWLVAARGCRSSSVADHVILENGEGKVGDDAEMKRGDGCSMSSRIIRSMNRVREMMEEMLDEEMAWAKAYEERRAKAREKEKEWRRRMEAMEEERKRRRRVWMEKEQQWRMRGHKREQHVAALLDCLIGHQYKQD